MSAKCPDCLDTGEVMQEWYDWTSFGYCKCEIGQSRQFTDELDEVLAPEVSVPPLVELL